MSYISKEAVAVIRAALKKEFPNVLFSVVRRDHSVVNVSIMKSDTDFSAIVGDRQYTQINTYTVFKENEADCYTENDRKFVPFAAMFNKIIAIMKSQDWYDKSDAMTDYFNTAYYLNLTIGKWDKPYVQK